MAAQRRDWNLLPARNVHIFIVLLTLSELKSRIICVNIQETFMQNAKQITKSKPSGCNNEMITQGKFKFVVKLLQTSVFSSNMRCR